MRRVTRHAFSRVKKARIFQRGAKFCEGYVRENKEVPSETKKSVKKPVKSQRV